MKLRLRGASAIAVFLFSSLLPAVLHAGTDCGASADRNNPPRYPKDAKCHAFKRPERLTFGIARSAESLALKAWRNQVV